MDGPGRFKAGGRGDVTITVELNGITSTPAAGGGAGRHLPPLRRGQSVERRGRASSSEPRCRWLDGPERLETLTDAQGQYVLFGVPGTAQIRITRAGYETSEQAVQLTQHQSVDFSLSLSGALPDFSGTYTLRISLATPCGTSDPGPESRDRTYTATITQTGLSLAVKLTGADMVVSSGRGDRFSGTAEPSGATFNMDEDFYGYFYPEVVERLPSGTHVVVGGVASTKRVAEGLVGTLNGSFSFYAGRPGQTRPFGACWSQDIRFALLK